MEKDKEEIAEYVFAIQYTLINADRPKYYSRLLMFVTSFCDVLGEKKYVKELKELSKNCINKISLEKIEIIYFRDIYKLPLSHEYNRIYGMKRFCLGDIVTALTKIERRTRQIYDKVRKKNNVTFKITDVLMAQQPIGISQTPDGKGGLTW